MKLRYQTLRLLGVPALGLCAGLSHAQEIESTEVNGNSMRVRIKTPQIEIERINPDGTTTTEVVADESQRVIDLDVPIDEPSKLFRAKVKVGDQEFGSTVRPLIEEGTVPDIKETRPSSISLNGDEITIQFPPNHSNVADGDFFNEGFNTFLDGQVVHMTPVGNPGTFTGQLPGGMAQEFRAQLENSLDRLRNTGEGTVPVFMGRQHTGNLLVPSATELGENFDLFPFFNGGEIQPIVTGGAPILGSPGAVDPMKSLMITNLSVVEDPARTFDARTSPLPLPGSAAGTPMGKWTFGFLMEQMCNQPLTGVDPELFARRWIDHFETPQVINFDPVPSRGGAIQNQIIDKWEARNISEGLSPTDLTNAPFRLTAIVNRVDLRSGGSYSAGDAGELRFVFSAYDLDTGAHLPMTVIFEYGVPLSSCADIKSWAQKWQSLTSDSFGSATFNSTLESLTDFVSLSNADPSKPNGSAINQVRSNDFIGGRWTLREWQVTGSGVSPNDLTEVTTKQTPSDSKNGSADLMNYINGFTPDILAGSHTVPLSFPGASPFLAGRSVMNTPNEFWDAPGIALNDARHCFSLNTCNGCHGGEAGVQLGPIGAISGSPGFVHVGERDAGIESHLSQFLTGTGTSHTDPVSGVVRTFNDLLRRQADLDFVANMPCFLVSLSPGAPISISGH